jgi:hypothetical protein
MRGIQIRDPDFFFPGSGIRDGKILIQQWLKTRDFLLINTAGESCVKYLSS